MQRDGAYLHSLSLSCPPQPCYWRSPAAIVRVLHLDAVGNQSKLMPSSLPTRFMQTSSCLQELVLLGRLSPFLTPNCCHVPTHTSSDVFPRFKREWGGRRLNFSGGNFFGVGKGANIWMRNSILDFFSHPLIQLCTQIYCRTGYIHIYTNKVRVYSPLLL